MWVRRAEKPTPGPSHQCEKPDAGACRWGDIWECDECRQQWKAVADWRTNELCWAMVVFRRKVKT